MAENDKTECGNLTGYGPFAHGEYVWIVLGGEAEMVMVEENHGPERGSREDRVTVRFINSEDTLNVRSGSLDREHPKARAAALVRYAAGR